MDEAIRAAERKYNQTRDDGDYKEWMMLLCRGASHRFEMDANETQYYCLRCGSRWDARFIYISLFNAFHAYDTQMDRIAFLSTSIGDATKRTLDLNLDETQEGQIKWVKGWGGLQGSILP